MARTFLRGPFFGKMLLRSFSAKTLTAVFSVLAAMCLYAPVALAQHGGGGHGGFGGGGHFGGGGSHMSAPGASHGARGNSVFHIFRRTTAGVHGSTLRAIPITTPVTLNSSGLLLRPTPHPTSGSRPQPVFFVPVYFGSPFFYGGFNSFGWCGCGPFWGSGCFYSPFYGYGFGYGGWGGYYGAYYGGYYGGSGGYTGLGAGNDTYSSNPEQNTAPAQSFVVPSYRRDLVELFFKDGSVYDVTDYWVVNEQIHFLTVDESGQKSVEHVLPFDSLDLQTTVDDNNNRGFKFQLRNQSMEQYFREHPEIVPRPVDPDAPQN